MVWFVDFLFVFVLFCLCIGDVWNSRKPRMVYFLFGGVCCLFYCVLSPFSQLQPPVRCVFLFLFVPSVSQTPKTKTDGELRALAKGTQQKGSGLPEIPPGCETVRF